MRFVSRADQQMHVPTLFSVAKARAGGLADVLFDTLPLPRATTALRWIRETDVHHAPRITNKLVNTNQFVGNQSMIVRDELRQRTFVISIEFNGLFISHVEDSSIISKISLSSGHIRRAHLCLRKYDGVPLVCYVKKDNEMYELFINNTKIDTTSDDIDFPILTISQPPVGFAATSSPDLGIITYKCRKTGQAHLRRVDPMSLKVASETVIPLSNVLGGIDSAIKDNKVILLADIIKGNDIEQHTLTSDDFGTTFVNETLIDLSNVPYDIILPGTSKIFTDHTDNIHVIMALRSGDETILLDVQPDDGLAVAAVKANNATTGTVVNFPKMPDSGATMRLGYGDGKTDGNGLIATLLADGNLLVANSQSGGFSYPDAVNLNYDMQKVYCFQSTECYTRGAKPNVVSMDYVFVEADDHGNPLSSELWIETWDMPLPQPVLRHEFKSDRLKVIIDKDACFFRVRLPL